MGLQQHKYKYFTGAYLNMYEEGEGEGRNLFVLGPPTHLYWVHPLICTGSTHLFVLGPPTYLYRVHPLICTGSTHLFVPGPPTYLYPLIIEHNCLQGMLLFHLLMLD